MGDVIDEIVTIEEGDRVYWGPLRLKRTSTVRLRVVVRDGAPVDVLTMEEEEFQHYKHGTHRYLTRLSVMDTHDFDSGRVRLPRGDYRVLVRLRHVPDGWHKRSVVGVRLEVLR